MKIYTKTGDDGETGLIGGTRVLKNDIRIEAYGTVDELNSFIGLLMSASIDGLTMKTLEFVQHKLFVIGSHLATDREKVSLSEFSVIKEDDILLLESEIDRMNEDLPVLQQFVLPGGSNESGLCHVCRTVTRRSERRILEMADHYSMDNQVIKFINRLSDYFFVLSRYVLHSAGKKEIFWKKE
ncbi:MAG: cob(I)yrinic acid a,c-diamide adenosyltransferase [Paludibacter sp.]|nr:cob(I)yrinic acid a,c-diamide adenosyltransferase [Paludibacter sp.]